MSIYVVGDIQGCYDPLRRLMDHIHFDPAQDRLWCVGDMVNRGPQSLETLRFLKGLGSAFTGVLGNHDLHFLALASGAFTHSKKNTLQALLNAPDCQALCDWVRQLPLAYKEATLVLGSLKKVLLVHAGIAPRWTFRDALKAAREVEACLRAADYQDYLRGMYGDQPDIWNDTLSGMARLRIITNILTRIRFCSPAGQLDFNAKEGLDAAPPGMQPWYELVNIKPNRLLLFGHWAALDGKTGIANVQALDTGCVWGRCLTALKLDSGERLSVACGGGL
ncbi:MAG: symmetrical bis(5'-nucleosyl)-tetraphosphatase [Pseudomonadales bacterium]|jgi:bis(5'-nucleosyl)-tetraphosphatase (symmetrical)|nr:symmetrical bis(5'-nucleosyl)-tetraphosphatase [Pseudomonadales bacterium]